MIAVRLGLWFSLSVSVLSCGHRPPEEQGRVTRSASGGGSALASEAGSTFAPTNQGTTDLGSANGVPPAVLADGPTPSASSSIARPAESPPPDGMLLVPGGTFTMGADDEGEGDERPAHSVTVASFYLDATEVTSAAYRRCVDAGRCRKSAAPTDGHPEQPVRYVSWDDASTYCAWQGRRLPREAEFERAVRGDDARRFPWGNEAPSPARATYGGFAPSRVGSHPNGKGPYGHLDLAGNVWEWMADAYDPYAYRRPSAAIGTPGTCDEILATQTELRKAGKQGFTGSNPIPDVCERSIRGGAYNYGPAGLRATNRVHHPGSWRIAVLGFRCAKDL